MGHSVQWVIVHIIMVRMCVFVRSMKELYCDSPEYPTHGEITGKDLSFGGTIHYTCKEGYRLLGSSQRTCISNGTWSGRSPQCLGKECLGLEASFCSSLYHGFQKPSLASFQSFPTM